VPDRLKVLLAEDSESDALLVERALEREGLDCDIRRVESETEFQRELKDFRPHIVLSDFGMPGFSGNAALRVWAELAKDIPFVFVSGTIGEQAAVEAMKAGASDYVMKSNLTRLGPAVRRELREAEVRRARRRAEAGLRRAQVMAKLAHVITRPDGSFESWSDTLPQLFGAEGDRLPRTNRAWLAIVHPDDQALFREKAIDAARTRRHTELEYRLRRSDGSCIHVRQTMEPLDVEAEPQGELSWFNTLQDVTSQRTAEEKIKRLNRVYAVLSGINALIVRARDRDELFKQACRIAVEGGKFPLAWIGVTSQGGAKLRLAAWEGDGEDFIDKVPILFEDGAGEKRGGLARLALRQAEAMVANDIATDPRAGMRDACLARGFRSLVALPLSVSGKAIAVLSLYADQAGFFDTAEMKLLLELSGDISFALDHLEKSQTVDYLSYYDQLTGLANRPLFEQRLAQQLNAASRNQKKVALLIFDVERFRAVNDSLGRQAGDALLKMIAQRMTELAPDASRLARIGGNRFAVMVPDVATEEDLAHGVEKRLQQIFGAPYLVERDELRISARTGIALFPNDGKDADALCRSAEAAVDKARETGERYVFFEPHMTARVAERLGLENRLRQAIEKEEFVLHYQPKVDLETRTIAEVEALIRWQSPQRGLVPPAQFIPLLEETGLILEVGKWALRRAALDQRRWAEQRLKAPRVAVNVSAVQLRQRDFVAALEQAIVDGVVPTAIDLELTESLVMEDIKASIEKLKAIRALGVRVAIDDFGTGYSSLGYLAQLPVESLKIDRSFIVKMEEDPNAMTLVSTIISLAHSLRLKVVAEGVETEEQAKFLRLLRCDQMQGYLFSKPVPEAELRRMLAESPATPTPPR
jgi:diguanylate cyclase (GGDEF)-like protein/PAS domain S-box-containing protein